MELFKGVMLSSWNSISGPKIDHLWLPDNHPFFRSSEDALTFLKTIDITKKGCLPLDTKSNPTVLKHQEAEKEKAEILSKTTLCEDQVTKDSIVWLKKFLSMSGKLLVAEIGLEKPFPENATRLYFLDNEVLVSVLFHRKQKAGRRYDSELATVCFCISVILSRTAELTFNVQEIIDLHLRKAASILQQSEASLASTISDIYPAIRELSTVMSFIFNGSEKCNEASDVKPLQKLQHQMKFFSRCIVSHLQTSCCSVIVGSSAAAVNQVAEILLLFNSKETCSKTVMKGSQKVFYMGLDVQCVLKLNTEMLPDLGHIDYPISIIDVDWFKVRQSFNDFGPEKNKNSLKTVTESGRLIPQLLEDLVFLEEHNVETKSLVENFSRLLQIKAIAVIKCFEKCRSVGCTPTQKELMDLLNISDGADLQICLGCAEKLKPGIRSILCLSEAAFVGDLHESIRTQLAIRLGS